MNRLTRRTLLAATAASPLAGRAGRAQAKPLKIGVLTDLSGIVADSTGRGSALAARLAAEEFGGSVAGRPVEILAADHQHKPDIGSAIARQWLDDGVEAIADLPNSAVALAVQQLGRDRQRIILHSAPGTTLLSNAQCSPFGFHWTYDTYGLAHATGAGVVATGGTTWFMITADYAFGHQLEKDFGDVVTAAGGRILGSARHPLGATDYASYLLQAQASGAKVVLLCNAGADTVNALKQANEFGLTAAGVKLATALFTIIDVHSMGLKAAQGALASEPFYWNLNEGTRAWSRKFFAIQGRMPSSTQIGVYDSVLHYLKAVAALGASDAAPVVAKMKATPINSAFSDNCTIRADHHVMRPMLLQRVKAPEQSKEAWDYMSIERALPASEAVWPLSQSGCAMAKA